MTDKEKVIKEAWDNKDKSNKEIWADYWNYEKAKEQGIDEQGFIKVLGYDPEEGETYSYLRPPKLKGIKNNNGWIKGTPTKNGNYKLYGEKVGEEIWAVNVQNKLEMECIAKCYTHYQEILKSKKPVY